MKNFTLQSVLNYRKILEDNAQREMAYLNNIYNDEKEVLKNIQNKLWSYEKKLKKKYKNPNKATEILTYLKNLLPLVNRC